MRALPLALASATTLAASICLTTSPSAVADPSPPDGQVARAWITQALDAVREAKASDAQAARTYALVASAMYDAVNGLQPAAGRRTAAIADVTGAGDPRAASASAAHDVLVALFPSRAAGLDAALQDDLVTVQAPGLRAQGREHGSRVAAAVLAARQADGASAPAESQPAGTAPGQYPFPWPGAQWRGLEPFVIDDPDAYLGAGPPALGSIDSAAALAEVRVLGSAAPADAGKSAIYAFWNLGSGTDQPAGAWLQVGQAVSGGLSLEDTTRLLALEALAMADTVAPTYQTKWVHHSWRPTHAIRQVEPGWAPRGGVGTSPEYWSGHSSFSAAAATALASFFCDDRRSFSLTSDSTAATRHYASFSEAAGEAGVSRVLGGLHFRYSNEAGLAAGRAIAQEVVADALLVTHGPTHHGSCPR